MVWAAQDTLDDAAIGVDSVKVKPLKKRCFSRSGGLSRYYSSKSQSFSSLDRVQCTPFGNSALALAKRPSSFDLRRHATGFSGGGASPRAAALRFRPATSFRESSPQEGDEDEDSESDGMRNCCAAAAHRRSANACAMEESEAAAGGTGDDDDADDDDCTTNGFISRSGGASSARCCPCNDTIFADPSEADAFISPTGSPRGTPLQLYGSHSLAAAAAAAQQLQLQQQHLQAQLTGEYLARLGALLPGQPLGQLGLGPGLQHCGSGGCDGGGAGGCYCGGSEGGSAAGGIAVNCRRTGSGCSGIVGEAAAAGPGLGCSWPAYPATLATSASCRGSTGGAAAVPAAGCGVYGYGGCDGGCGSDGGVAEAPWRHTSLSRPPEAVHSSWGSNSLSAGSASAGAGDTLTCDAGGGGAAAAAPGGWYRPSLSAGGCSSGPCGAASSGMAIPVPAMAGAAALPPPLPLLRHMSCSVGSAGRRSGVLRHRAGRHGGAAGRGQAASALWGSTENLIAALSLGDKRQQGQQPVPRRATQPPRPPSPAADGGSDGGSGGGGGPLPQSWHHPCVLQQPQSQPQSQPQQQQQEPGPHMRLHQQWQLQPAAQLHAGAGAGAGAVPRAVIAPAPSAWQYPPQPPHPQVSGPAALSGWGMGQLS